MQSLHYPLPFLKFRLPGLPAHHLLQLTLSPALSSITTIAVTPDTLLLPETFQVPLSVVLRREFLLFQIRNPRT